MGGDNPLKIYEEKSMKSIIRVALLVVAAASIGTMAWGFEADKASTETLWKLPQSERIAEDQKRQGPHYANRMKFFYEDNKKAEPGCIVFLGDSITEGFPIEAAFNGHLPKDAPRKVVNRGISGDHLEGMIERVDVCVRDLKPSKVYIMGGTNDLWWFRKDYKEGEVKDGISRLVRRVREVAPKGCEIYVQSILPINHKEEPSKSWDSYTEWVGKANKQLKEVVKEENVHLVDTNKALSDEKGYFIPRFTLDGVHVTPIGYLRWIDELLPVGPEKEQVWKNLAKFWDTNLGSNYKITGVNKIRWEDDLIKYDNKCTSTTTGTNVYGYEVLVENDKVTSVSGTGNMPIPKKANACVLSGHGKAAAWLKAKADVGAKVKIDGKTVEVMPSDESLNNARREAGKDYYYEACRREWMALTVAGKDVEKYYPQVEKIRETGDDAAGKALLLELQKIGAEK